MPIGHLLLFLRGQHEGPLLAVRQTLDLATRINIADGLSMQCWIYKCC